MDYYIGEDVYYLYYYIFRIIFVHICPCSALVLLNVLLFRALSRTAATRERLFAGALAAAAAGAGAGATTGGTTSNTHDGNATSFYSAFGVTSHSKASLPYSNCLMTPMTMRNSVTTTTNSTVVTANGQSKTGGMVMMMMTTMTTSSTTGGAAGAGGAVMTAQTSLDSPPTAVASSGCSSRKVSLEISGNHQHGKWRKNHLLY